MPHCGEAGHAIVSWRGDKTLNCPHLELGTLMLIGGKIIRDNRNRFAEKRVDNKSEFPEFTDDLDFFDSVQVIDA